MDDGVLEGLAAPGRSLRGGWGEWPHLLLLAFSWGFGGWLWTRLPEAVPVHWDWHMQPNGWGGRGLGAFLLPAVATALYLLLGQAVPLLTWGLAGTPRVLRQLRWLLPALMVALQVGLYGRLGLQPGVAVQSSGTGFWLILALFWMVLGNLMPRLEVRTPHRDAWRAANRMGGRALVAAGLLQIALIWLPPTPRLILFLVTLLAAGILPYGVAQRHINRSRGLAGGSVALALPWLHRNDLLAVLGEVLVLFALGLTAGHGSRQGVAIQGLALPLTWVLLLAEARLRRGGEVQRARNWLRGWLILGLAAEFALLGTAQRFGGSGLLVVLCGSALPLGFAGLGQWTARRAAPAEGRDAWGVGPALWDPLDPRIVTPRLLGWTFNFTHLGSWLVLAAVLAPLLTLPTHL